MTKKTEVPELDLARLNEVLLTNALPRIACVLKPYPENVPPKDLTRALENLAEQGLIHPGRDPNLTLKGRDLARSLAAARRH